MSSETYDGREETVIGVHESGVQLVEGANTSNRFYCGSCGKGIHCRVKIDPKTKKADFINTCTNTNCECRCKTHYSCKLCGYLHPYGMNICDYKEEEPKIISDEDEKAFEAINQSYRDDHKEDPVVKKHDEYEARMERFRQEEKAALEKEKEEREVKK